MASESHNDVGIGAAGSIKLWDVATGKELRSVGGHKGIVAANAFAPDGKTMVSASWDKTLKLWNIETGEEIRSFPTAIR